MGNNKESCDEIILGIRGEITRFVLSKVDQELNELQELSVNCQQQQNINSPNDNNNQLGDDRSYHNAPPYYHTQHNTTEVPTPQYSSSNKTTNSPFHRTTNSSYGFQAGDSGAYHNVRSEYQYEHHDQHRSQPTYSNYQTMGHSEVDQWRELGDGGTYHNVPSSLQKSRQANLYASSHKLYQNHTKNTKEQSEINHSNHTMLQEPEHGDGHDANYDHWYGHNIHTDDYYPYYEQYQLDINICYSNLIEITPSTNSEKDIKPKMQTYGVQKNGLQSNPEIYRNPSMTNPTNTTSTFNSTRLGLPIYYSSNYNQYFLGKGRIQLERDK